MTRRHKLDMSFEEFTENYIGGDNFDWDEFEEITKDIRHYDLILRGSKFTYGSTYDIKLSDSEKSLLLEEFGED